MGTPTLTSQEVEQLNARFERAHPTEAIRWAVETFRPDVALTSSFGVDSAALIHMAIQVDPRISIRFIDTGFHFPETLRFMEDLRRRFHLNLSVVRTRLSAREIERLTREHATRPIDERYCCGEYKLEATERALAGLRCWITGLIREEAPTRQETPVVELLDNGLTKVSPIAPWSMRQLHAYMEAHRLPFHPLWEAGYTSIGCALHTQKPVDPRQPRSGRWAGEKTECGIHGIGKPKRKAR